MDFLASSGGFLGVMVTLIVLCIYINNNNFIHEILREVKEEIDNKISSLGKDLDFNEITDSFDYKLLVRYIDCPNEKDASKLDKAYELYVATSDKLDEFRGSLSPTFLRPATDMLARIDESKEQVTAPLYSLMLCVLVFIADELIHHFTSWVDMIISALTILIIVSYFLWAGIWVSFNNSIYRVLKTKKRLNLPEALSEKISRFISFRKLTVMILFTEFVLIAIIPFLSDQIILRRCVFFIPIIVLLLAIGGFNLIKHPRLGTYSYDSIISHFAWFTAIAIGLSIIFWLSASVKEDLLLLAFNYQYDFIWLKLSIFLFVLLNGLILPFAMPYHGYKKVLNFSIIQDTQRRKDIDLIVKQISGNLSEFCKDIS